jgi:adenylate kinase
LRVVILGPPGCGKGTQATRLCARERIVHLSTGDLLRDAVAKKTTLGAKAKPFMDAGGLVPDDLVIGLVLERIEDADARKGFLLDGFPRTIPQADALDAALGARAIEVALYYTLSDDENVRRLLGRGRSDDTEPVIRERLRVYHTKTEPLVARYRASRLLAEVDASGTVEQVEAATKLALSRRPAGRGGRV